MNNYFSFVPIYNFFIEKYMIKTNPSFVIIYIYLLKASINNEEIYLEKVASSLNMLASDIIKSLDYWQNEKLIKYEYVNSKIKIDFINFDNDNNIKNDNTKIHKKIEDPYPIDDKVTLFSQKDEIQQIFRLAEKKLAKPLTYQDRNILIDIFENYNMSIEVLAMLLTYCIENGKNNLNYIEKVAIDWYENNVDTPEKVEAYIKIYNKDIKTIMRFFGINNRMPIRREEEIIKNWLLNYKFQLNIIEEACSKTIAKCGNASFEYANTILKEWYEKGIKSLDDIEKLDNQYKVILKAKKDEEQALVKRTYNNSQKVINNYPSRNKFINYDQKEPNYELLRKIELMTLRSGVKDDD